MAGANSWNENIINDFREHGGETSGPFAGRPLLLLTAKGAKSGKETTSPLMYNTDGSRLLVFASKGGAPTNPDWYYNVIANPEVTVEVGAEKFQARAVVVTGEERDKLYAMHSEQFPQFGEYQKGLERKIPVIALERIAS